MMLIFFTLLTTEGIKFGDMPLFLNATAGEDTFIQCKVTSNPPPVLDWLKDRSILRPGKNVLNFFLRTGKNVLNLFLEQVKNGLNVIL